MKCFRVVCASLIIYIPYKDVNSLTYFFTYRLGLDIPGFFGLTTTTVDSVLIPTKVKSVKSRIMDITMGPNHTVCLTDDGNVSLSF